MERQWARFSVITVWKYLGESFMFPRTPDNSLGMLGMLPKEQLCGDVTNLTEVTQSHTKVPLCFLTELKSQIKQLKVSFKASEEPGNLCIRVLPGLFAWLTSKFCSLDRHTDGCLCRSVLQSQGHPLRLLSTTPGASRVRGPAAPRHLHFSR